MSIKNILLQISEQGGDIIKDIWYLASAVVMSSVNRPEDIQHIYDIVSDNVNKIPNKTREEKNRLVSKIILRLREGVFKSHVIVGFPKTINALQTLSKVTPEEIKVLLPNKPLRKEETWSDVQNERQRGKALFDKIYDKHTDKVYNNMYNAYPDLAQTALHHLYGPTLAESSILNAKETSLVVVSSLMVQNVPLQLKGHLYGASHNGATQAEIDGVKDLVSKLADYYKVHVSRL
ncbi:hypothetical protein RMCBS344292_00169 [Rhizopus microsporus]|nr:hypothetical protein RMCBS344292_00169 [Rhizopus microsporus]